MHGPLGTHSPNLNPLSALGIEVQSDAERQRFVALQVLGETRRVKKLPAYQSAYDRARTQQLPGVLSMNLTGTSSALPRFRHPQAALV